MRVLRQSTAVAALLCFGSSAGCYKYSAVNPQDVLAGSFVRAQLSEEGAGHLQEVSGRESREVEGELVGVDAQFVRLVVRIPSASGNAFAPALDQRLMLQRNHIVAFQVRELDQVKTGAGIATAAAAVGFVIFRAVSSAGGSTEPSPPGGPGEGSVVPSVPWPPR
jgi:hypothetical protein